MRLSTSWRRFSATAALCVVALLAFPAIAGAESWISEYPFGTIHIQPSIVSVDVFGAATLNGRTAVIRIDGVAQRTSVTQGPASGHWTSTETLVDGVWTIQWTWVPDTEGTTKATLRCYPPVLADGLHNVTATVKDVAGVTLTATPWSFTLAAPPTITNMTPGAGTTVNTLTPIVSAKITDNVGVTSATATVNGVAATVGAPVGDVYSVTGFTVADGPVTVAVTAGDAAGNTATRTWTFNVSTVDQTCVAVECHGGTYPPDHPIMPACTQCHPDKVDPHGYDAAAHETTYGAQAMAGTWTMSMEPTKTYASVLVNPPYVYSLGCLTCHEASLASEHGKATSAPVNISACMDCHPSPRNTIAGGWDKSCATAGCHTAPGHQHASTAPLAEHSLAASVTAVAPGGLGCSASPGTGSYVRTPCHTTDLIQEHNRLIGGFDPFPTQAIASTFSVSCEECHSSAAFAALNGAWDGTCDACHPTNHSVTGSARNAEVRALHQASRFYDSGQDSGTGASIEGTNAMDAHGLVRTVNNRPYGCANQVCHLYFYTEAGLSSFYPANTCAGCHGPNIAPMTPYEGSHMWQSGAMTDGDDLTTDLTLTMAGPLPANSALDFKTSYNIEPDWDYGYVQVSTNGGSSWVNLASTITTTTDPNLQNLGNGITGTSGDWVDAHFDLSAYAGQTIMIRFSYVCDAFVYGDGWYIDLVSVGPPGAPVFSDDVETLKPEWAVTSNATARWTR